MFSNRHLEVKVKKSPGSKTETRVTKDRDYDELLITIGFVICGIIVVKAAADASEAIVVHAAKVVLGD